jgi:hypothetical protein
MSFTDLTIEDYTDKSIAVQGNTRKYKEDLKKLGGKYNGSLKNGPGWIFPKTLEKELRTFVKNGKRLVTEEEETTGEERSTQRSKEWSESKSSSVNIPPTLSEYASIINLIKSMSKKIDFLENSMNLLLTEEQKKINNNETKKLKTVKVVKSIKKNVEIDSDDSDTLSENNVYPPKRLMR